ncbi:MAG: hypothetical protein ACR2F6_13545 [Mycobacteriales bacterium]
MIETFSSTFGDWKKLFSPLYPAAVNATPKSFNSGLVGKLAPPSSGPYWKMNGQYRNKGNQTLEIKFTVPNGNPVADNIVTVTTALLTRIGVKLDRVPVDTNKFFDDYIFAGKFEMSGFQWGYSATPASDLKSIFQMPTGSGKNISIYQNTGRTGSKQIDDYLNKAVGATDPAQVAANLNAADKLIFAEVNVDPIY